MSNIIKIHARPKLRSPNLLAAWPGIGNVSMIIANYVKEKLNFKELGSQSRFYYHKNEEDGSDLILFLGDDQPSAKGYELSHCVLDVGQRFQVQRVYTCAAAMTRIHHTEVPKVWGVATNHQVMVNLYKHNLEHASNLQIAGLNGILLGVAKQRAIDGLCLLGEVPTYASRVQNPMAALAVIKVLTTMLEVKIDLADLSRMAVEANERMKRVAAQAMEEYINYFTEPEWESGDEEDEEED